MTMLTRPKVEKLEQAWRDGVRMRAASLHADVSTNSVCKYFKQFKAAGIPRGALSPRKNAARSRRKAALPRTRRFQLVPDYTGPEWIGRPA